MRNFYFLLVFFALASCSVDNEEIISETDIFGDLNAVVDIEGCESESYSFGDAGVIEVVNDGQYLYVSIVANEMYELSHTKLHIAESEGSFPTVGQGNLPPGQMKYKETFDPAVRSYTFKFPLADYEGCIYIASQSMFHSETESGSYWAGDISGKSGNWAYFEYCIQTCEPADPPCEAVDAGSDNLKVITFSEAVALPSWDEVRKLYLNLLEPGVDRTGSFDPSIWDIINDFNQRGLGDYSTIYTIGEGECTDTVRLTIRVVADSSDPGCGEFAGADNLKTISFSEADAIPSWDEVRKLYLSLLEPGVSREGTFDPSIWDIINDFNVRGAGDYTTEYTVVDGDCTDTVRLTIRVIPD